MSIPKYSKLEIERRWLVPSEYGQTFTNDSYKLIEDSYLACGRLRLRSMTDSLSQKKEYKLCKKYGQTSDCAEPITNIYLSESEYQALLVLEGSPICKRRYVREFNGHKFSFDVFERNLNGLILCEIEGADINAIKEIKAPDIVLREITSNKNFSGGELSKLTAEEFQKLIKR